MQKLRNLFERHKTKFGVAIIETSALGGAGAGVVLGFFLLLYFITYMEYVY